MYEKYFARAGDRAFPQDLPGVASGARRPILYMDESLIPDTSMTFECSWFISPFAEPGYRVNANDAMAFMCGIDRNDPENLFGEVTFALENDVHAIAETCAVYIPAGCAHKLEVVAVDRPIVFCYCEFAPAATRKPAEPSQPAGRYADHVIYRYEPTSGIIPEAPEGFLQTLIWMAGDKVAGAPYLELCRFMTVNPTGPEEHTHPSDEFIGFLGTDPDHPSDLGGEVRFFLGGEEIATTKSTVIYVPGNIPHSPLIVPELHAPDLIHFSGSCATTYERQVLP